MKPDQRIDAYEEEIHSWEAFGQNLLVIGLTGEILCLLFSLRETAALNERAAGFEKEAQSLHAQADELSGKMMQLAHQYDMSTNALAEANARLASVRPLKARLEHFK